MKTNKKSCLQGLSIEVLERMAQVLKLLAHPHRLKIIEILEGEDGVPVHRIMADLGLPHAATSQHLNLMKRVGLVASARRGREVCYRIADERPLTILNCIRKRVAEETGKSGGKA